MRPTHSGKVREIYREGAQLLLVASDRVSVFDVVLPTPIPDKGALLTALSAWWFERLADLVPNHMVSAADVPEEFAGRALRCRPLEMIPVECIARGYLTGSGLVDYRRGGAISGVRLPDGLAESGELPEPVFTPTTKAESGHDEPITFGELAERLGGRLAGRLRELTLAIYRRGAGIAAERGILLADTKLEFGWDAAGVLTLGDEVLTSDSSRFWPADAWRPGSPTPSFDKQYLRDWAAGTGWDKTPPAPEIPPEVVEATRLRYIEAYERLTGNGWSHPQPGCSQLPTGSEVSGLP
jgi:phosphoribosylaminoimidazole-succinocarboxamide synthase